MDILALLASLSLYCGRLQYHSWGWSREKAKTAGRGEAARRLYAALSRGKYPGGEEEGWTSEERAVFRAARKVRQEGGTYPDDNILLDIVKEEGEKEAALSRLGRELWRVAKYAELVETAPWVTHKEQMGTTLASWETRRATGAFRQEMNKWGLEGAERWLARLDYSDPERAAAEQAVESWKA